MGPAESMGTFLRTWRAEWAGLSRGQLAIAVSAEARLKTPLKAGVIRAWEDGQPPKTTEELGALTKVMRRHGLTRHEVDQFRSAVFASCVDRHYPSLFEKGDLAQRPDVEQVAAEVHPFWAGAPQAPRGTLVDLVALAKELDRALREDARLWGSSAQERRARAAGCRLRGTLAEAHAVAGRGWLAVREWETNARELETHFGPAGLDGSLHGTVLAHWARAAGARTELGQDQYALRFLEISQQAGDRGEDRLSMLALGYALSEVSTHIEPIYRAYRKRAEEVHATVGSAASADELYEWHYSLTCAAAAAGELAAAERHLAQMEEHMTPADPGQALGAFWAHAVVEYHGGSLAEARSWLGNGLALADETCMDGWGALFRSRLERWQPS